MVTGIARGVIVAMLLLAIVAALPLPGADRPARPGVAASGAPLAARGEKVQRALGGVFGDAVQESIGAADGAAGVEPSGSRFRSKWPRPRIDQTAEEQMLVLVNRRATKNGLEPCRWPRHDPRGRARLLRSTMFQQGYFAHVDQDGTTPFDRMRAAASAFGRQARTWPSRPTVQSPTTA